MLILLLAALLADVPAPSGGPYVTYRSNPTLSNEKVLPTCAAGECLSYNGSSLFCGTCSAGSGSPPGGLANDLQINNGSGGFSAYAGTTCAYAIKSLDDDGDATCTAAPTIPPPGGIVNDIQTNNGSGGFGVYAGTTCAYAVKSLDGDGVATCTAAPTIPTDLSAEPFITKTASGNLSGEFALGSLATGIIVNTTTTGIPTIYGGTSCSAGQYMNALNSSGVRTCAQVAYSELSGTPTIPADISAASFITKVAEAGLSNEFAMGSLGNGLVLNTTTTGVPTIYAGSSCSANQYALSTNASGALSCAQVAYSQVSGTPTIPADISNAHYVTTQAEAGLSAEAVLPTCTGSDKLTFNGTTISCSADLTGSSGGLVEVDVDFGTGNTNAKTVVTGQAWVTSSSKIICAPTMLATSTRAEGAEDAIIEGLTVAIYSRVAGTGFTVAAAPRFGRANGVYKFHCSGT